MAIDVTVSGLNTEVDILFGQTENIDVTDSGNIIIKDYESLINKPQINGVTLTGNKTSASIGVADATHTHDVSDISDFPTIPTAMSQLINDDGYAHTYDILTDYDDLTSRPKIEGVTLTGNKTFADLTLEYLTNLEIEALLT